MAKMNMLQAINNALDLAMAKDDGVVCFGEDVGHFGGVCRPAACVGLCGLDRLVDRRGGLVCRSATVANDFLLHAFGWAVHVVHL